MLNDSIQNEKKKPDFFSSDLLIKIEETVHDKIIAIKNPILTLSFHYWKVEIITIDNKLTKQMNFDFEPPKIIGMVLNFILSYFISLISKGIQIAKTNKNRPRRCNMTLDLKGMSFSKTSKNIVLIVQIKEMIKILENGIFLNPKGYETDRIPEKIIAIWVLVLKSEKRYKLITAPIIIIR